MFKIARTAKHLFSVARNMQQAASASINSIAKYCSQSKGYIEDARDEFTFAKVLPNRPLVQDHLSSFDPATQVIAKPQSINLAEIRKLIYARFADEIVAKPDNSAVVKAQDTREYIDAVAINNIAEEFKELREQGYNFKELRDSIVNHNSSQCENIAEKSNSDNGMSKSLSNRMKELIKSGYMSSCSGEPYLRHDIELIMNRKSEVIKELIHRVQERAKVITNDTAVLLVDLDNGESVTDIANTALLGESMPVWWCI